MSKKEKKQIDDSCYEIVNSIFEICLQNPNCRISFHGFINELTFFLHDDIGNINEHCHFDFNESFTTEDNIKKLKVILDTIKNNSKKGIISIYENSK